MMERERERVGLCGVSALVKGVVARSAHPHVLMIGDADEEMSLS